MALREQFVETVIAPLGAGGSLIPLEGIGTTVYNVNPDGTEGAAATAYAGRTGNTLAPSVQTDASGKVSYYLDPGEYNVHFDDTQAPPRVASFIRAWTSLSFTLGQLLAANQPHPVGAIAGYGGSSDPVDSDSVTRWLICDGRAISRTTYADLFGKIGTTYGAGDGTTTFNIPDGQGRALIGAGAGTGLTARNRGDKGGAETAQAEIQPHTHTYSGTTAVQSADHTHPVIGSTGSESANHYHGTDTGGNLLAHSSSNPVQFNAAAGGGAVGTFNMEAVNTGFEVGSHTHAMSFNSGPSNTDHDHVYSGTTASAGAGGSHNNMQPYTAINFIIKVL